METFLVIVVLVMIVGGVFLYQKVMNAAVRKTNQSVFMRGAHREGQELVSQRLVFNACGSVEDVKKAVLSTVQVAPHVPPIIADAYLISAVSNSILFGYGNKLKSQNFRGLLSLHATTDGVQGSWEIANWTLVNGIVDGQSVMKRLVADINKALKSVDANAALRPAGGGVNR